jgi:hypothetical protein
VRERIEDLIWLFGSESFRRSWLYSTRHQLDTGFADYHCLQTNSEDGMNKLEVMSCSCKSICWSSRGVHGRRGLVRLVICLGRSWVMHFTLGFLRTYLETRQETAGNHQQRD